MERLHKSIWLLKNFGINTKIRSAGGGMAVSFPLAWLLGGMDRAALATLMRRKKRPGSDAV